MIDWLHDRPVVMYAAIFACIVCATLYRTGIYPQLDRTLKSWDTGENFLSVGRAIGAIDKPPAPETKADTTSRSAEDFGSTP
ncbi:hypothetical protein [Microcoleus sp. B9-D4]|uniref:hypothetical protein n=1 Tax=Microcoleus sp. B9-D4 TaxID=2818711 RepID=UPI002FCFACEC